MNIATRDITGVILAGGRGSRLGGADKGLVPLHGRPLIEHVIDALRPQVDSLLISANRNQDVYASYGYPVIADVMGDYDGPLAGMLSAMRAAGTAYILTAPCDAPSFPADLARRLAEALVSDNAVASAVSLQGRLQPVFALLRCSLAGDLENCLKQGERGTGEWLRRHRAVPVDFSDAAGAFMNINTLQELQAQQDLH
ncbi:MAG TPA: molybdenum cofactor guanylyltransferase MobA [Sulfuricaulis sp.]|nr:molybdenum cofactor guanylyltransferase MobA [Sulfuricaulis sp.]